MKESSKVTIKDVSSFWENHAPGYNELKKLYEKDKILFFIELDKMISKRSPNIKSNYRMHLVKELDVLDIGCGQGYNAEQLVRNGANLTGIDLTDTSIKLVKERFKIRKLKGKFYKANAESLPFKNNSFDYIHSSGVIHHTPNINKAVSEIYRVLRFGGRGSIMVYNKSSWTYWFRIQIRLRFLMIFLYLMPVSIKNIILSKKPTWINYLSKKWPKSKDIVRTGTDFGGIKNPLSRVYTKKTAKELFSSFKIDGYATSQSVYKPFKKKKNIMEKINSKIYSYFGKKIGWYLFIYFTKENN